MGPSWPLSFESGGLLAYLDTLFVLTERLGMDPATAFGKLECNGEEERPADMARQIRAVQVAENLVVHFRCPKFDAH